MMLGVALAALTGAAALDSTRPTLRLFDTLALSAGLRMGIPLGDLAFLRPTPAIRLGATSSYADGIQAIGSLQYSRLSDTIELHYATAAAGLSISLSSRFSIQGMLSLHYARSARAHVPAMQLDGGESEFGTDFGFSWTLPLAWCSLRPGTAASVTFTTPSPSWWVWSGVDVDWRLR